MTQTSNKPLAIWLFSVSIFIITLMVFGAFVRLTRSGLSMVEWNVVTGIIPPMGEEAWQEAFVKYRQTPEFQQVNTTMTVEGYKSIYYIEYFHRILGRLTGLVFVVPLFIFLVRRTIPLRQSGIYLSIGLLFAGQGLLGWYMVQSGLIDQPHVSHYRLTAHLLLALLLLALCFWTGLNHASRRSKNILQSGQAQFLRLSGSLIAVLFIQIGYGGFVAGLKAGHASDTFPLMYGYLIPPKLLSHLQPWTMNLVANVTTVHFIHRWFAFVVLSLAVVLYFQLKKSKAPRPIQTSALIILGLLVLQISLGVSVIIWHVPLSLALIHQATALILFVVTLLIHHQLLEMKGCLPQPMALKSENVKTRRERRGVYG